MTILKVFREWESAYNQITTLKTQEGKVKKTFDKSINQPRKGKKTIVIINIEYQLDWSNI